MVWLGDDSDLGYVGELRKEIEAHGWQAQVRIMGRVTESEKRRWLSEATLFAMPAIEAEGQFEGFGLVYLEASAAGLPVIGTRGTAVEEAIRDGETGVLVPVSDPVALATAAIQLLRDEGMRQRMGGAGQRFAASLTWGNTADQLVRVYESQISQKEATK
jgi:phosphatidylinositol alpha-1,6-mannosyltransferase